MHFSANSLTPKVSQIIPDNIVEARKHIPCVYYAEHVYQAIWYLVEKCSKEVGWLGLIEPMGQDFMVTQIYVPRQEVTGAETDISPEAMADLAEEIMRAKKDPGQLLYWGHSHVNMGVSPSGQDETQIAEYLQNCDMFIRGIYNKRGESKVDVFDKTNMLVYEAVPNGRYHPPMNEAFKERMDKLIAQNVKEQVFVNTWQQNQYNYPHLQGGTQGNPQAKKLNRYTKKEIGEYFNVPIDQLTDEDLKWFEKYAEI